MPPVGGGKPPKRPFRSPARRGGGRAAGAKTAPRVFGAGATAPAGVHADAPRPSGAGAVGGSSGAATDRGAAGSALFSPAARWRGGSTPRRPADLRFARGRGPFFNHLGPRVCLLGTAGAAFPHLGPARWRIAYPARRRWLRAWASFRAPVAVRAPPVPALTLAKCAHAPAWRRSAPCSRRPSQNRRGGFTGFLVRLPVFFIGGARDAKDARLTQPGVALPETARGP